MQEVISIQKYQAVKKNIWLQNAWMKKCEIKGGDQEMAVIIV